jgi:hypothetical protein
MGPFDRIIWAKKTNREHAVIITFDYGIEELDDLFELESKLRNAIELKQVGEYDGHEIAMDSSDGTLYMYGPNAEVLFKCIKPILDETGFMRGAIAQLRFGPPSDNVKEIEIEL